MKRVLEVFIFAAAFASVPALAQEYPSRAVREEFSGSPEDFRRFLAQDQANTVKVIKAAQLQAE